MQHGDISNQRSYVIGFRCEGTLFHLKDKHLVDKVLNSFLGKFKRADVDQRVLSLMDYIYNNTEYTIALVIDEKNFSKEVEEFLADYPCNIITNCSVGQLTSMLNMGQLSYLVDNSEYNRSVVNSKYCVSFEDFNSLLRRHIRRLDI